MKTILVTGAVRNTGLAIARRFAADGWGVALTSRDAAAAEATAKALKAEFPQCEALGIGMDPAKVADIRAAFAAVRERFGRLDAYVNNAANLGVGYSVLNSTEADWDAVMNANARAAFFGAQEAVKLMAQRNVANVGVLPITNANSQLHTGKLVTLETGNNGNWQHSSGSLVFISSCHAKKAMPARILYTASKAAVGGIVRSLAVELGPLGIRANAILAGAIRTDRWDGFSDDEVAKRRARWPIGRETTGDQIAAMCAFLCSDAAATITGAEIPVDSGIGVCLLANNPNWMESDPDNAKYLEATKNTKGTKE